jgi:arsenate reductase
VTFDYIVAVSDAAEGTVRHYLRGRQKITRKFPDLSDVDGTDEEKLSQFRKVRDEIKDWMADFVENGNG